MKNEKYTSALVNYDQLNKKLWAALFVMLGIVAALVFFIISMTNREKTIIVPAGADRPFSVKGDEYSNEYKEQMALYVLQTLLTFQPNNVKYQFNEVLRYVHPSSYAALRAKLSNEAKKIASDGSSSVFYASGVTVDGNEVAVRGELVGSIGNEIVSRKDVEIKLTLETQNGFFIQGWNIGEVAQSVEAAPAADEETPVEEEDFLGKKPLN